MDQELIDRIYESSLVPELWPGVLDELGRIAEGAGGTLWITKADVQYWTASPGSLERAAVVFNEGLFWRGQLAARTLAARHAGFLTGLDHFTPDEWDQEPLIRDFWRPQGIGWLVGTVLPIPTGENVLFILTRRTEREPFERAFVQKLCGVIISGRELSVWQPHIAARVNPLIENCKQMTIALPTLLDADNKYANELLIEINSRQQQINRFEGDISNPNVRNNAALASISELTDQVKQAETKLSTLRAEILSIDQSVLVACGKH